MESAKRSPEIVNLNYTYTKPESGVAVLSIQDLPIDHNLVNDQQIVHLAPQGVGGNHQHPRTEWFVGIGELTFIWLDEQGIKHEEEMNPNGQLKLITVPPMLPHAVFNKSTTIPSVLFEMADAKMKDSQRVEVI